MSQQHMQCIDCRSCVPCSSSSLIQRLIFLNNRCRALESISSIVLDSVHEAHDSEKVALIGEFAAESRSEASGCQGGGVSPCFSKHRQSRWFLQYIVACLSQDALARFLLAYMYAVAALTSLIARGLPAGSSVLRELQERRSAMSPSIQPSLAVALIGEVAEGITWTGAAESRSGGSCARSRRSSYATWRISSTWR